MARPDLGKKWNYVVDFWADGCDGPLTVYFEAAYPALLHAALSYYCPDPVNMFTGYVRPGSPLKGTRGGSHARGGNKSKKRGGFWGAFRKAFRFSPDDWIAKKMPFADEMEGRQVPGGARWMWTGYGAIERFNNYMFMYAIVEDAFYEFSAGVARSVYCQNQQASVFEGFAERDAHFALIGQSPAVIHEVLKNRNCHFVGGNGVRPNATRFSAGFSCSRVERWDGNPDTSSCKLVIIMPDGTRITEGFPVDGRDILVFGKAVEGGTVSFVFEGPYSFNAYDLKFSVFGYPDVPTTRPEGWCNDLVNDAINWVEAR